jgi:hypothetical protein
VDQKADLVVIRFHSGITDTRSDEVHDEFLVPLDLSPKFHKRWYSASLCP